MAKKYPENWANSPAGKAAKPGIGGKDTRLFSEQHSGHGHSAPTTINPNKPEGKKLPGQHGIIH
jgi:hypothetical protein